MCKNYCKQKINNPKLNVDCIECKHNKDCALKKWNERQLELDF